LARCTMLVASFPDGRRIVHVLELGGGATSHLGTATLLLPLRLKATSSLIMCGACPARSGISEKVAEVLACRTWVLTWLRRALRVVLAKASCGPCAFGKMGFVSRGMWSVSWRCLHARRIVFCRALSLQVPGDVQRLEGSVTHVLLVLPPVGHGVGPEAPSTPRWSMLRVLASASAVVRKWLAWRMCRSLLSCWCHSARRI
jgi:hypothetical protein